MADVEASVEEVFANVFRGHPCVFSGPGARRLDLPADAWSGSVEGDQGDCIDLAAAPPSTSVAAPAG